MLSFLDTLKIRESTGKLKRGVDSEKKKGRKETKGDGGELTEGARRCVSSSGGCKKKKMRVHVSCRACNTGRHEEGWGGGVDLLN